MQAVEMRDKQINIRLSDEEAARFSRVADHYGLNVAGTIRMLFKEKAREIGIDPPGLAVVAAAIQGSEDAKLILERRKKREKAKKR